MIRTADQRFRPSLDTLDGRIVPSGALPDPGVGPGQPAPTPTMPTMPSGEWVYVGGVGNDAVFLGLDGDALWALTTPATGPQTTYLGSFVNGQFEVNPAIIAPSPGAIGAVALPPINIKPAIVVNLPPNRGATLTYGTGGITIEVEGFPPVTLNAPQPPLLPPPDNIPMPIPQPAPPSDWTIPLVPPPKK